MVETSLYNVKSSQSALKSTQSAFGYMSQARNPLKLPIFSV